MILGSVFQEILIWGKWKKEKRKTGKRDGGREYQASSSAGCFRREMAKFGHMN